MEKGFIAQFERKVLFRIARFVAFSICFLLFLSVVGGGLFLLSSGGASADKPDPAAVAESLKPAEPASPAAVAEQQATGSQPSLPAQPALHGVKLPPVLQEFFLSEDNQQVLRGWLDALPEEERQPFIDGLAATVEAARKNGVNEAEAINRYHEQYAEYVAEKAVEKAAAKEQRLYAAAALVSTLMLIALFSLVLVLLAIERNTREQAPVQGAA